MSRKRGREKPTLDGVLVKIEQAENHLGTLERDFERVFPGHRYVMVPEIYDQGIKHVFKARNPPAFPPIWSALVGDLFHNLRTSLDHLAHQLVLVSGREPTLTTQFPIHLTPPRTRCSQKRTLPDISPGVREDIRKVLEVVQPYSGTQRNHGLDLLRDLDNIDKHRRLVVVAAAAESTISTTVGGDPSAPPSSTTVFTRNPIEHDEVIAIVTYERPYPQPDPNLYFLPHIAFGERNRRIYQDPLPVVTGDLFFHVRDEVIPKFEQFFPSPTP